MLADGTPGEQWPGRPIGDSGRTILARHTAAAALARLADEGSRVALLLLVLGDGLAAGLGAGVLLLAVAGTQVLAGAAAIGFLRRRGEVGEGGPGALGVQRGQH